MGIYGGQKREKKEEPEPDKAIRPFKELCKFADEFQYYVELDKPFVEFDKLILKVVNKKDGEDVARITVDGISALDSQSAKLLNRLAKDEN